MTGASGRHPMSFRGILAELPHKVLTKQPTQSKFHSTLDTIPETDTPAKASVQFTAQCSLWTWPFSTVPRLAISGTIQTRGAESPVHTLEFSVTEPPRSVSAPAVPVKMWLTLQGSHVRVTDDHGKTVFEQQAVLERKTQAAAPRQFADYVFGSAQSDLLSRVVLRGSPTQVSYHSTTRVVHTASRHYQCPITDM